MSILAVKSLSKCSIIVALAASCVSCSGPQTPEANSEECVVIKSVLNDILSSRAPGEFGGFVIFHGSTEYDYVQYSLDEGGLVLNWPTGQKGGSERLPLFIEILKGRQFVDRSPANPSDVDRELILSLDVGEMCVADDGLYAQCGRNADTIADLTRDLLMQVFTISDCKQVKYTLEIDG